MFIRAHALILQDQQPKVMLEFGAYCGYSAVRIARLLPEGAKLYSFEFNPLNAAIATKVRVTHATSKLTTGIMFSNR